TVAHVKTLRAGCATLVERLCQELGDTSSTCQMVKERTESFPPSRCQEMLAHYPEVLAQLKQMEARGGGRGAGPMKAGPRQGPPGAGPQRAASMPGAPPSASPAPAGSR
ncbi:MAG TPA: hypothetical protein PLU22_16925, partial [Polyangiaceae bacterium]|nr:hypothetical protein [Polyangiaceae bacterium]